MSAGRMEWQHPDGPQHPHRFPNSGREDLRSDREKAGWCRCGKHWTEPRPECGWHSAVAAEFQAEDETLDDRGYVMPYAPVPAWQHRAVTPEQQLNRRVGIPLAIGTGITFLVCGAGAVVGVIWALSW